ncbi:hypothetical protein H5392_00970 [Tessaracoccus sp. MC1865]|uniref:hypothetical protein n=1 Tax=Tessaracoccus sp. MC1865 TaxID=2760310 RepID=UPI0015FEEB67|nr:hypothetical protein [Tessaracoccus sp. MC1865]MBB1482431.1 hypothetical protein [Tessaracoccus sp. MC1865]QTO38112.1 hypothetical protein J7D54_03110 [Tessaracoccus sp. MC1865]
MGDGANQGRGKVIVTNFDSVAQARLWRERGSAEATDQLLAMLRTAVLLGEDLQLDRNQLFDGIFFLALGPDRIGAELGLQQGASLPIRLTGSAPEGFDLSALDLLNSGMAIGAAQAARVRRAVEAFLDIQLGHVRSAEFQASSSAMMAVCGSKEGNAWLLPPAGPHWFPGTGFRDRLHPMTEVLREMMHLIAKAQDEWADALLRDRLTVGVWRGGIPILEGHREELRSLGFPEEDLVPLARDVSGLETQVRKVALDELASRALERWGGSGEGGGGRPRDFTHSEAREMRFALELWSRGYYRAIARRDGAMLVAFAEAADAGGKGADPLRRAYGLEKPDRDLWQRIRDAIPARSAGAELSGAMRIDGEILDHLRQIDPGVYRQLTRTSSGVLSRIRARDSSAMMDLALATREAVSSVPRRRPRIVRNAVRVGALTLVALLVAFLAVVPGVVDLSRTEQVAVLVGSAMVGALAGLPWDEIGNIIRLRPSALTATLNITLIDRIHT